MGRIVLDQTLLKRESEREILGILVHSSSNIHSPTQSSILERFVFPFTSRRFPLRTATMFYFQLFSVRHHCIPSSSILLKLSFSVLWSFMSSYVPLSIPSSYAQPRSCSASLASSFFPPFIQLLTSNMSLAVTLIKFSFLSSSIILPRYSNYPISHLYSHSSLM